MIEPVECIWEMAVDSLHEEFIFSMFTVDGVKETFTIPRDEAMRLRDGLTWGLTLMTGKEH